LSFGAAILGLAFLILIHEAGHFFAARGVGMRPRKFYIGFPPAVLKRTRGGVEYGIGAIPLGGYVKIPGMHRAAPGDLRGSLSPEEQEAHAAELDRLDAALERGDEDAARAVLPALEPDLGEHRMFQEVEGSLSPDAYWRQDTWKRVVVIAAGPLVNVAAALLFFMGVFMSTVPTSNVHGVVKGYPAAAAGIKAGDRILTIAGKPVSGSNLAKSISATDGRPFRIRIDRAGRPLTIGPVRARNDQGVYRIGIQIEAKTGLGASPITAGRKSAQLTWALTSGTVTGLGRLFFGQGTHQITSSVGIVRDTAAAYRQSLQDFFFFLGYISLALALLNLLPILPLDGGHIVMSILERVRGRAFSQLAYLRYSAIGLALFMFLLYLGLRNDLFSGGG
jgi:regulator of sigma E protease